MKHKEETGDANCLVDYVTKDAFKLGRWQNVQRQKYDIKDIKEDQIEKLESIDFKWKLPHYNSAEYKKWRDSLK